MDFTPYFEHPIDRSAWISLQTLCAMIAIAGLVIALFAAIEHSRKLTVTAAVTLLIGVGGFLYASHVALEPYGRMDKVLRSEAMRVYRDVTGTHITEIDPDPRTPTVVAMVTTKDGQTRKCSINARDFDRHIYELLCDPSLVKK